MFQPSYQLDIKLNGTEMSVQDGPVSNKGNSLMEKFSVTLGCAKLPLLHSRQATIGSSTG